MDGEIVARVERRRRWTAGEKAALLAEIDAEGGQVSLVARRHGISKSLLYNWRSTYRAAGRGSVSGSGGFIELGVIADPSYEGPAGASSARGAVAAVTGRAGVIEIDLPSGVRVRVDGSVEELALRRVLSAVRGTR